MSHHVSDDLYFPNRPFVKQYISLGTPGYDQTLPPANMTPPAGDDVLPHLNSTYLSLNPIQSTICTNYDEWLSLDSNNGFIRLYDPNDAASGYPRSKLVPCTMWTTVEQMCSRMNYDYNPHTWHVQLNGYRVRRLRSDERPLFIQYNYLLSIGFSSIQRLQQEGAEHHLGYLIRFLSDQLIVDPKIQPRSLSTLAWVRKGKLIRKWIKRKCVISTSRLTVYPDANTNPCVIELQRASVEEIHSKDKPYCLKLSVDEGRAGVLFIALNNDEEYSRWLKRLRKTTNKLPDIADYSSSHLELIPKNLFINQKLSVLNLRHNSLMMRPMDETAFTLGWLDDLVRFQYLISLNLADNDLGIFPPVICQLPRLIELNLASNNIDSIPAEINRLQHLETLNLQSNRLTGLPTEIESLKRLRELHLHFNLFKEIPLPLARLTNIRCSDVTSLSLAGNHIRKLTLDVVQHLEHCRQLDLRMNQLKYDSDLIHFNQLNHLTQLDVSHNHRLIEFDLRALNALEKFNCSYNNMTRLILNGHSLRHLNASHNKLKTIDLVNHPANLVLLDISSNEFQTLPDWFDEENPALERLIANHNRINVLPARFFTANKRLQYVRFDHNCLSYLPERISNCNIETLLLHCNRIEHLPAGLLKHLHRLKVLNLSHNQLASLPLPNDRTDLNRVQELYLSCNELDDDVFAIISRYERLKILYLAYNRIEQLDDTSLNKLVTLTDLNLAGNNIQSLPQTALSSMENLQVLTLHSNRLRSIPDLRRLTSLEILDLSFNMIDASSIDNLFPPSLSILDISGNHGIHIQRDSLRLLSPKAVSLINISSGLSDLSSDSSLWSVGFAQSSGSRNRLSITTVKEPSLNYSHHDALFAMFDGGLNNEVPLILKDKLPSILLDEYQQCDQATVYLKHTFLTLQRRLKSTGQRLGAAATVVHIRALNPIINHPYNVYSSNTTTSSVSSQSESQIRFELNAANVGHCEAILCRSSMIHPLTRRFTVQHDDLEYRRVKKSGNIIIHEDNGLNAITSQTRMLGCSFLYPAVLPNPNISSFILNKSDEFFIIANNLLWQHLSHEEAVRAIRSIHNPVLASKKLVDLAQSYGAKENLAVLIVRFNFQRKIHHVSHNSYNPQQQQQRFRREATLSANTSSGDNSPMASPQLRFFDSTGYLSAGDLSAGDDDDEEEEEEDGHDEDQESNGSAADYRYAMNHHYANIPQDPRHEYLYLGSDQISSSSDAPATLNDSIQNRVISRSDRTRHLAASLNDTSKIDEKNKNKLSQSDTGLFNFPALNAEPVRIIPSELSVVSEILSTSPTATLSRVKKMKTPSFSGDCPSTPRPGRYRKKLAPPARPPLGYSKPPRTELSSNSDVSNDLNEFDFSPVYPAGLRPVADAVINPSSSDEETEEHGEEDEDEDDDDFSYVVDRISLASTNTNTDYQQQQNELNSFVRKHYPSISSTTHSTVNSTLTSSSVTTNQTPQIPANLNRITRL